MENERLPQKAAPLQARGFDSANTDSPGRSAAPPALQLQAGAPLQMAASYPRGNITYETEDFQYGSETRARERVQKVTVSGRNTRDTSDPNAPLSFHSNDTGKWDDMDGWHKGHVAARAIGGTYASYNMVPMLPNFNCGSAWKKAETEIDKQLSNGATVRITPNYNSTSDERVPNSMTVNSDQGLNATLDHSVPIVPQTTDEDADYINKVASDKDNLQHATKILDDAVKNGQVPSNYRNSPYFPLDVLWLSGIGPGNPWPRKSYESWQTEWLIKYNKRLNGGIMVSDSYAGNGEDEFEDPHAILSENGRQDRPEADHIIPNSHGGANLFSNARLVSWELNNKIQRVVNAKNKFLHW